MDGCIWKIDYPMWYNNQMLPLDLAGVATNRDIDEKEDATEFEDSDFDIDDISEHKSITVESKRDDE